MMMMMVVMLVMLLLLLVMSWFENGSWTRSNDVLLMLLYLLLLLMKMRFSSRFRWYDLVASHKVLDVDFLQNVRCDRRIGLVVVDICRVMGCNR